MTDNHDTTENTAAAEAGIGGEQSLNTDMFAENFAGTGMGEDALPQGDEALENQQSFTIKYNGEQKDLPLSDILTLAQKGMNYDKIYGRLQNQQTGVEETAEGETLAETDVFLQLCEKYPDLEELPQEAAQLVHEGVPPLYAYESYLTKQLSARVNALEQETKNRATTPGSAAGIGSTAQADPFTQGFEGAGVY